MVARRRAGAVGHVGRIIRCTIQPQRLLISLNRLRNSKKRLLVLGEERREPQSHKNKRRKAESQTMKNRKLDDSNEEEQKAR